MDCSRTAGSARDPLAPALYDVATTLGALVAVLMMRCPVVS